MTNIPIREKPCKKAHNSKNIGCRMASPKKTHKVGGKKNIKNYQRCAKADPDTTIKTNKFSSATTSESEERKYSVVAPYFLQDQSNGMTLNHKIHEPSQIFL